ncbi:Ubiquitin-like domain-containing protein [Aphelenchoides besseyi]|nr:Ubiquitin-like domain-containing protein [Aphelenchoides besseyi]
MSSNVNESSDHLEFILRFSLQKIADQKICCPDNWTVLQLKKHILETCDSKPEIENQRLIYAGHLMRNEQKLSDVFNRTVVEGASKDETGVQVVHVVIATKEDVNAKKSTGTNELRSRSNAQTSDSSTPNLQFSSATIPTFDGIPQDVNQAYALAYHNYLRGYYTQQNPSLRGELQMTFGGSGTTSRPMAVVTGLQNAQPNAQVQQPAENERVAAAGVEANNQAPDFLDLLYKLIRLAFLGAIVLYSSMERIIFVVLLISLMWYVHMRRERDNRAAGNQNTNARNEPANQMPANPQAEDGENANDANNNELIAEAAPAQASAWLVFRNTITSFFASLVPEPLPVNVN